MYVEMVGDSFGVVMMRSELLESAGLATLVALPFLLAGPWLGTSLAVAIAFSAIVIHAAIRNV